MPCWDDRLRVVLDGYAIFVREKELALAKHQPHLVRWVREFLVFAREHAGYTFEQTLDLFLATVGGRVGTKPWQLQQAADAYASTATSIGEQAPSAADAKAFLTPLAMVENVSASAQNQAFSALLLLFREVLRTDLEEMAQTVRARRGPKPWNRRSAPTLGCRWDGTPIGPQRTGRISGRSHPPAFPIPPNTGYGVSGIVFLFGICLRGGNWPVDGCHSPGP